MKCSVCLSHLQCLMNDSSAINSKHYMISKIHANRRCQLGVQVGWTCMCTARELWRDELHGWCWCCVHRKRLVHHSWMLELGNLLQLKNRSTSGTGAACTVTSEIQDSVNSVTYTYSATLKRRDAVGDLPERAVQRYVARSLRRDDPRS